MKIIAPDQGMLYYIIEKKRPDLAKKIKKTGIIETVVVGLGGQGNTTCGTHATVRYH